MYICAIHIYIYIYIYISYNSCNLSNFKKEVFFRSNPYENQTKAKVDGKIFQRMKFTSPLLPRGILPK